MAQRELVHRASFEAMGETSVRVLAQGNGPDAAEAVAWLAELAIEREAEASKETLLIAKEANRIASEALASSRRANKIAISAIVFASATAIVAAVIGTIQASAK